MSAYQANVKVEPPTKWVGSNAVFDRSQLHHIGQQGKRPPTPSLPAGGAFTSSRPEAAATGAAPWAAKRSEQRSGVEGRQPLGGSRAAALAVDICKADNQGGSRRLSALYISSRLIDLSHNKNDDV